MSDLAEPDDALESTAGRTVQGVKIGRNGKPYSPVPWSWPETRLAAIEQVLASGDLDWVARLLESGRTARAARSSDAASARVEAIRVSLAAARIREAAAGRGSLIDPNHNMTLFARQPPGGPGYVAVPSPPDLAWNGLDD